MADTTHYRFVIADDHPLFRGALREAVSGLFQHVEIGEAGSFEDVAKLLDRGGEVDLILRDRDGTLVFVEVRKRRTSAFGGAAGSVTYSKQRSIVLAAHHFLRNYGSPPPCRFDVVAIEDGRIEWLKAAFDAS